MDKIGQKHLGDRPAVAQLFKWPTDESGIFGDRMNGCWQPEPLAVSKSLFFLVVGKFRKLQRASIRFDGPIRSCPSVPFQLHCMASTFPDQN